MMIERRKMTRTTYQALKRYILREREKKKQEQEQDKAQERLRRERELQKKKEEEDSLTLEQTKEQLVHLETKLDVLKQEKHGLFSELKKVLHQENDMRQRAQMKEQNEMATLHQQQCASIPQNPVNPIFIQGNMVSRSTSKYLNIASHQPGQAMKRSRSPSPPNAAQYYAGQYTPSGGPYSGGPGTGTPGSSIKQEPPYCAASEYGKIPAKTEPSSYGGPPYGGQQQTGHSAYAAQVSSQPPPSQQYQSQSGGQGGSGPGKYALSSAQQPPSQPSFVTYPPISAVAGYNIYQQQVQGKPTQQSQSLVAEQFAAYSRQSALPRRPQSGYLSPHHGPPPGSQQLEKTGFSDVKAHQQAARSAAVQQQMTSGLPPRGNIVSGYSIRPQQAPPTSIYTTGSGSLVPPRHQSRY